MMRRFLMLMLALLLFAPAVLAEDTPAIDLDSMSGEELLALHREVGRRLTMTNSGDVVYDADGIVIRWVNLLDLDYNNFRYGITIENTTGEDVEFALTMGAMNGMQFEPRWNTSQRTIKNGFSVYTGSYNSWKPDNYLADFGITHVTDIYLEISLYQLDQWQPFRVIEVRFPVDMDISDVLK